MTGIWSTDDGANIWRYIASYVCAPKSLHSKSGDGIWHKFIKTNDLSHRSTRSGTTRGVKMTWRFDYDEEFNLSTNATGGKTGVVTLVNDHSLFRE